MALCISGDSSLAKVGISFCISVHFYFAQNNEALKEQIVITTSNLTEFLFEFESKLKKEMWWSVPSSVSVSLVGILLTLNSLPSHTLFLGTPISKYYVFIKIMVAVAVIASFCFILPAAFTAIKKYCYAICRHQYREPKKTVFDFVQKAQKEYSFEKHCNKSYETGDSNSSPPEL